MTTRALMSAACKQSMRDSDQDGLRDDIELYGVPLFDTVGNPVNGGWLARYGALPGHYDVFVEVDYRGTPFGGVCTSPVAPLTRQQVLAMASQHAFATSITFPNRNGVEGISTHYDVGPGSGMLPTDTVGGDWGGSNCYVDNPPCTSDASCGGAAGSCCTSPSGCGAGGAILQNTCITMDARSVYMSKARRWLFFALGDINGGGGGGGSPVLGLQGYGGGAAAIVHELGHQGGLEHGIRCTTTVMAR